MIFLLRVSLLNVGSSMYILRRKKEDGKSYWCFYGLCFLGVFYSSNLGCSSVIILIIEVRGIIINVMVIRVIVVVLIIRVMSRVCFLCRLVCL